MFPITSAIWKFQLRENLRFIPGFYLERYIWEIGRRWLVEKWVKYGTYIRMQVSGPKIVKGPGERLPAARWMCQPVPGCNEFTGGSSPPPFAYPHPRTRFPPPPPLVLVIDYNFSIDLQTAVAVLFYICI